jgi:ABC-type multidrug transport system fused ATPase/permease subunit
MVIGFIIRMLTISWQLTLIALVTLLGCALFIAAAARPNKPLPARHKARAARYAVRRFGEPGPRRARALPRFTAVG